MTDGQAAGGQKPREKRVRGDRIVQLCFVQKRSQGELAEAVGMVRTVLSAKLHGKRRWYLDEVIAIADVLGTSVAYLIGESDSPEPE